MYSAVPDNTAPIKTGVLLVNLGTPDAPTPAALRRYLGEFLADPRVTEMPRLLWWFILHGIILRIRPRRAAQKYQRVWTEESGSPLLSISQAQAKALSLSLGEDFTVVLAMRYGNPSIAAGLEKLRQAKSIVILPLYPQYSGSTNGSTFDAIADVLKTWRIVPDLRFISHYYEQSAYIQALAVQIKNYWAKYGIPDKLLFSFHGVPTRFVIAGDPYFDHCKKTAELVAAEMNLTADKWELVFQSRFGREEWLKPYTVHTLTALGNAGVNRIDVICPGFAADCLETLEEINQENRQIFLKAGGQVFNYIPALNDNSEHIQALALLVKERE